MKVTPPISPYGTLSGDLFLYGGGRAAFESAPSQVLTNKKLILLGGLSDGLMPVPYTEKLQHCCHENQFSMVQPILSSSYTGFGHGSLDRDCAELQQLMDYLEAHRCPQEECEFCLVGHSTGCQDIVHFLRVSPPEYRRKIKGFVLQAPVSDREHAATEENYDQNLALAREMRASGRADECMPRSVFWAPITAKRFLDLQEKGGNDDYFSSDYNDDEMHERLGHCIMDRQNEINFQRHGLVAFSAADEYAPDFVDTEALTRRLTRAMNTNVDQKGPCARSICIPKANHNLSKPESGVDTIIAEIHKLLQDIAN